MKMMAALYECRLRIGFAVEKVVLLGLLLFCSPSPAWGNSHKQYPLAMVFNGGGFGAGVFLGALSKFKEEGIGPDIIIATSGGSVAAALAHVAQEDESDPIALLASREYYKFLKKIKFNEDYDSLSELLVMTGKFHFYHDFFGRVPDIFAL